MSVSVIPSWRKVIATIFPLAHTVLFLRAYLLEEKMESKTIVAL